MQNSFSFSVLLDFLLLGGGDGSVVLGQMVGELLVGRLGEHGLLPQVGSEVSVGLTDGGVCGLGKIAKSSGRASSGGVAILDTGHTQELLGNGGADETGTTGSGDETHQNGAALAGDLAGHGVGLADLVTPETSTHGHDGELGEDDGAADGGGNLLGALNAETDVAVVVSNGDEGLEKEENYLTMGLNHLKENVLT